jgi:hypothetical protein
MVPDAKPWNSAYGQTRCRRVISAAAGGKEWVIETYDGDAIEAHYSRNWLPVAERLAKIGPPMMSWYLGMKLDNATKGLVSPEERQRRTERRAVQLREALVSSGSVTFIKSGGCSTKQPH